jgi:hypothetical protein
MKRPVKGPGMWALQLLFMQENFAWDTMSGARRLITLICAGSSEDYRRIVIRRAQPQTSGAS